MRRKISNAPAPIEPLDPSHAAPEQEPKAQPKVAEPKQPTESYFRFLRAIHRKDRRVAEFYADKCRNEGLPETKLSELALLDAGRDPSNKTSKRRGRLPKQSEACKKAMQDDIQHGQLTIELFREIKKRRNSRAV
jgi:hypothetical protein